MQIKHLTPDHAVAPQITVADMPAIKDAGFKTIICNRPDGEIMPANYAAEIKAAAENIGLAFCDNPFDDRSFGMENITAQQNAIDTLPKPILAYCRTGTRCSIVWAFANAKTMPADDIINAAQNAGYDLRHLKAQIDHLAQL